MNRELDPELEAKLAIELELERVELDQRADAVRRDRGLSLYEWVMAPRAPASRPECEGGARPCAAFRCLFHLGKRATGFSCMLDFLDEVAPDERTHQRIGDVTGYEKSTVTRVEGLALDKLDRTTTPDVRRLLGVRGLAKRGA